MHKTTPRSLNNCLLLYNKAYLKLILSPSPNDLGKNAAGPSALGINLRLLLGPDFVMPAPADIIQAIKSVEVINTDSGRDGFQITFSIGRGGEDPRDYTIFNRTLVKPFTRVIIIVDV